MALSWWFRRLERRRQTLEKRAPAVRAMAFEVVRDLALPPIECGDARLEWTEPDEFELKPANEAAAKVAVIPGPGVVTLLVGPRGQTHELVVDRDGDWRRDLRACVGAVVEGRYRESAAPGKLFRVVLTMTFEMPDGRDVVVKHFDLSDVDPPERGPGRAALRALRAARDAYEAWMTDRMFPAGSLNQAMSGPI